MEYGARGVGMRTREWDADQMRVDIASCLTDIVSLYAALPDEAVARSAEATDFPGGDALNMLGPAANLEAWQHRYEAAEQRGFAGEADDYASAQVDSEEHPLLVLATWEDLVREERDQPTSKRATVEGAAKYLRDSITWMFGADEYGDMNFLGVDALLAELRKVRSRLEGILHDGIRAEYGAPCLYCRKPLERLQDDRHGLTDHYRCRGCGRSYPKDHYDYAVGVTYLYNSPRLTAAQIEEREGIKATRVRVWGSRHEELKAGKSPEGLFLYWVDAVVKKYNAVEKAAA